MNMFGERLPLLQFGKLVLYVRRYYRRILLRKYLPYFLVSFLEAWWWGSVRVLGSEFTF